MGRFLGIALGITASAAISMQLNWPTPTPTNAIVGDSLFRAAIRIFFGYYPDRKAARLNPIDSLRYE